MTTERPGRIASLDLVRGVAVMGILSVNIIDFAMVRAAYFNPSAYGGQTGVDLFVWAANLLLVDGKMRALFSMLFGASMLLIIDLAEARSESGVQVHLRRMLVLFGFGLLHYVLLWSGDILHVYAVAGVLAFAARRQPVRRLLLFSAVFLAISMVLFGAYALYLHDTHQAVIADDASKGALAEWRAVSVDLVADPAARAKAEALQAGPWALQIGDRFRDLSRIAADILIILPETLGLMFAGMAAFRSGLLTGAWPRERLRRLVVRGLGIGLVAQGAMIVWDVQSGFEPAVLMGTMMTVLTPFRVVQALATAALIIVIAPPGGWLTERIQAVGRMAFSNYLGTSILLVPVFAGWGLGLFDRLSRAEAWLFAPAVWLIMLAWSKPWLDRFRYGPLEWVWRSLSRGALQPMRRANA